MPLRVVIAVVDADHDRRVRALARIASQLQETIIQRIFATGLTLQSTAARMSHPDLRERVLASADDLDQVLRLVRDAIVALDQRQKGQGLRADILSLSTDLSPAPEVSFAGPVDGALDPASAAHLMQLLTDALETISLHAVPARIEVIAGDADYTVEIEVAGPRSAATAGPGQVPAWVTQLENQAGMTIARPPASSGIQFTWSIPLAQAGSLPA